MPESEINNKKPESLGLYIHWPFCQSKCHYCDFVSFDKDFSLSSSLVPKMLGELTYYFENYPGIRFDTVFFGGGTPSLIPLPQLEKIINKITPFISPGAEVSIEINPASGGELKLREYSEMGINRVSFGVQSFDDGVLKQLGRRHSASEAIDNFRTASRYFDNINIDLMFGVPGEDIAILNSDLDTIIRLNPAHVSIYSLIVEEGTPFWERQQSGELSLPDEDTVARMYELIIDRLGGAGYGQYEVSNFAKPGRECRHNYNCWENREYIGIGVGAHSFFGGARYANPEDIGEYMGYDSNELTKNISNKISESENLSNRLILGLRKLDGVELDDMILSRFGDEIRELANLGLLQVGNNRLALTKRGLFVGNEVFEKFVL